MFKSEPGLFFSAYKKVKEAQKLIKKSSDLINEIELYGNNNYTSLKNEINGCNVDDLYNDVETVRKSLSNLDRSYAIENLANHSNEKSQSIPNLDGWLFGIGDTLMESVDQVAALIRHDALEKLLATNEFESLGFIEKTSKNYGAWSQYIDWEKINLSNATRLIRTEMAEEGLTFNEFSKKYAGPDGILTVGDILPNLNYNPNDCKENYQYLSSLKIVEIVAEPDDKKNVSGFSVVAFEDRYGHYLLGYDCTDTKKYSDLVEDAMQLLEPNSNIAQSLDFLYEEQDKMAYEFALKYLEKADQRGTKVSFHGYSLGGRNAYYTFSKIIYEIYGMDGVEGITLADQNPKQNYDIYKELLSKNHQMAKYSDNIGECYLYNAYTAGIDENYTVAAYNYYMYGEGPYYYNLYKINGEYYCELDPNIDMFCLGGDPVSSIYNPAGVEELKIYIKNPDWKTTAGGYVSFDDWLLIELTKIIENIYNDLKSESKKKELQELFGMELYLLEAQLLNILTIVRARPDLVKKVLYSLCSELHLTKDQMTFLMQVIPNASKLYMGGNHSVIAKEEFITRYSDGMIYDKNNGDNHPNINEIISYSLTGKAIDNEIYLSRLNTLVRCLDNSEIVSSILDSLPKGVEKNKVSTLIILTILNRFIVSPATDIKDGIELFVDQGKKEVYKAKENFEALIDTIKIFL